MLESRRWGRSSWVEGVWVRSSSEGLSGTSSTLWNNRWRSAWRGGVKLCLELPLDLKTKHVHTLTLLFILRGKRHNILSIVAIKCLKHSGLVYFHNLYSINAYNP